MRLGRVFILIFLAAPVFGDNLFQKWGSNCWAFLTHFRKKPPLDMVLTFPRYLTDKEWDALYDSWEKNPTPVPFSTKGRKPNVSPELNPNHYRTDILEVDHLPSAREIPSSFGKYATLDPWKVDILQGFVTTTEQSSLVEGYLIYRPFMSTWVIDDFGVRDDAAFEIVLRKMLVQLIRLARTARIKNSFIQVQIPPEREDLLHFFRDSQWQEYPCSGTAERTTFLFTVRWQ